MSCWGVQHRLSETVAEILLNPRTQRIMNLTLHEKRLRFKCQQCAVFCCKLGGPTLSEKDVKRIEQVGYCVEKFLDKNHLKNEEDGSCIFLNFNRKKGIYECAIYDFRPALCRLYPFSLEKRGPNSFVLKLIPCCNGLNSPDGELVNEKFIINHLLDPVLEIFTRD